MSVPEEPVCIYLFRRNPVFTSLHLKSLVHVNRLWVRHIGTTRIGTGLYLTSAIWNGDNNYNLDSHYCTVHINDIFIWNIILRSFIILLSVHFDTEYEIWDKSGLHLIKECY
jgi:hypothetical protein